MRKQVKMGGRHTGIVAALFPTSMYDVLHLLVRLAVPGHSGIWSLCGPIVIIAPAG